MDYPTHLFLLLNVIREKREAYRLCEFRKRTHATSTTVSVFQPPRSMADEATPLEFAVRTERLPCVKELLRQLEGKKATKKQRVGAPTCLLKSVGTGR